jgi:hypothetical protein
MTQAEKDFRTVLSHYPLENLHRLDSAFEHDRVVTGKYHDARGRGCLMFHLDRITSKADLQAAFPGANYAAPRDLVRHFDDGRLTIADARRILLDVIETRIQINLAEECTLAHVLTHLTLE